MSAFIIAVGSRNPVKINSALAGFQQVFPDVEFEARGFAVDSRVNDQPMSCQETLTGATNRAKALRDIAGNANFFVGIEGGIETIDSTMFANAWIVIEDKSGNITRGSSGSFALPSKVQDLIEGGVELGVANDQVFNENNSKHAGGAVGSLTGGVITRQLLYEHAMVLALTGLYQNELYGFSQSELSQ